MNLCKVCGFKSWKNPCPKCGNDCWDEQKDKSEVLSDIKAAESQIDAGKGIDHDDVKKKMLTYST